jgi:hypothetical protein
MKAGRPSYHVPAKWITVGTPQGLIYFELDKKGNLITKVTTPHHITCSDISATPQNIPIAPTVPLVTVPTPVTPSISGDDDFFDAAMEATEFDFDWDMADLS